MIYIDIGHVCIGQMHWTAFEVGALKLTGQLHLN